MISLSRKALLIALALACLLGAQATLASAAVDICTASGSVAGECKEPRGVATDLEADRVYVAEQGNHRVSVFEPDGAFVLAFGWDVIPGGGTGLETCTTATTCKAGLAGSGTGQFLQPTRIAVDNTSGAEQGKVYVGTDGFRVQKFEIEGGEAKFELAFGSQGAGECQIARTGDPIAVGPGGNVFVADSSGDSPNFTSRIEKFSPAGVCLGETKLAELNGPFRLRSLAVDSNEEAYVPIEGAGGVRKYDLGTATKLCELDPGIETNALVVDAEDHLFASQREPREKPLSSDAQVITEYDPACKVVHRFGYGQVPANLHGLAVHPTAEGDLFASAEGFNPQYLTIPPLGPIVAPLSVEADPIGNTKATIKAEVNPEGKATSYRVEYLTEQAFAEQGGFVGPQTKTTTPQALNIPSGKEFRVLSADTVIGCPVASEQLIEEGKCLEPETEYRFRVIATNADNPSGAGEGTVVGQPFTTKDPIEVGAIFATDVGPDAATINAEVNPLGIPATGHFEYVEEVKFQESGFVEASLFPTEAEIEFGSLETPTVRSALLSPLPPGTTYRYRLIATNPFLEEPLASEVKVFTTFAGQEPTGECPANEAFRIGPGALLPDCRAYELVSPLDKANGDIVVLPQILTNMPAVLNQSAAGGDRLSFGSSRSFGDAPSGPYTSQYLASRNPPGGPDEGWQTRGITPPQEQSIKGAIELDFEFRAFSEDLCESWVIPLHEPPLAEAAIPGYYNLYRRTDQLCGGDPDYEALTTAAPQTLQLPQGGPNLYQLELQGLSADGSVVAFAANDSLEGSGAPAQPPGCAADNNSCRRRLYVKAPGQGPSFVCVLPGGAPSGEACSAGTGAAAQFPLMRKANLTNALSAAGDRIFWSASDAEGPIYRRENPTEPESARLLGRATGTGNLIGPATATGNLASGSVAVTGFSTSSGAFAVGQDVSGPGIAPGTLIAKVQLGKIELSQPAGETKAGAEILGAASDVVTKASATTGAFAVGQEIAAAGGAIPKGTTIAALEEVEPGLFKITLSAKASATKASASLEATSECTEEETKACSFAVSEAAEEEAGTASSHFWAAADDGSRAIFSTGGRLYEHEVEGETTQLIAASFRGILGTSEDARRIYFVSTQVLSGEEANGEGDKAEAGANNLYLYEAGEGGGSRRFIGALAEGDMVAGPASTSSAIEPEPGQHNGRASADGLHAVFMSAAPLTGYDNTDAVSGEPNTEVFLYDAAANSGAGELRCVSCNPTGARPRGVDLTPEDPFWVAGKIPAYATTLYAPRVLAPDGTRLFFESQDALVARDTNSRLDVYQWEEAEIGSCDQTDTTFSPQAQGCVDLISSGQSAKDSQIVDASASGDDVFFTTLSGLLPQDYGLLDVYDARVGGGFPVPPPPDPECEGETCQSPPAPPEAPTPASAGYEGPGDATAPAAKRRRCPRGKRRAKRGKGRCVARRRGRQATPRERDNQNRRKAR